MSEIVDIPVADLQFDPTNPRLGKDYPSQQAIAVALAEHQGRRLLTLAAHIVDHGLDPTTLSAVVPTGDRRKRYMVIEGNRRLLAVKALETPALVGPALAPNDQKRLTKLAERFAADPIKTITCVLFDNEADAHVWIETRHTGANDGAGLVEWNSDEKNRYQARHGQRNPAGQVIDLIDKLVPPSDSKAKIITNVGRVLKTKRAQELLGIEIVDGQVRSRFPAREVAKGLGRLVDDLRNARITSRDIYTADDIAHYVAGFSPSELPNPKKELSAPVELSSLASGITTPAPPKKPRRTKKAAPAIDRTAIIPATCALNVTPPWINAIYVELSGLTVDQYPNAGAVLLRVFLELSVDHELDQLNLLTKQMRDSPLAKRLRTLAADMKTKGRIPDQLEKAVTKISGSQDMASTTTFNQYVHNKFVFPKPSELRTTWDELRALHRKDLAMSNPQQRYPSPLRYPGGKGKVANFVKLLFLENDLVGAEYVEPYAGGSSVALSLLFEEFASHIHINDINRGVHAFWSATLNETEILCARITDTPMTVEEWKRQRSVQQAADPDHMDLAFSTFFLNRTNRSGIISGGIIGGQDQSGPWKLDARYNTTELIRRIQKVARFGSRITLTRLDAATLLGEWCVEDVPPALVYLDPPYYVKGGSLYDNFYRHQDHVAIAECVQRLTPNWIVSYDAAPEILGLFGAFAEPWRYSLHYSADAPHEGSEVMFFAEGLVLPSIESPAGISVSEVDRVRQAAFAV